MKKLILVGILLIAYTKSFSQTEKQNIFNQFYKNHLKTDVQQRKGQFFAEVNPQFINSNGYGLGYEFSRFQVGCLDQKTELSSNFKDVVFNNSQSFTIPKSKTTQLFANAFLRKDRKGLYAGTTINFANYTVIDNVSQQKKDFSSQFFVARAGFRWFPLQDIFYLDCGYGASFNISNNNDQNLGNSKFKPNAVHGLPFLSVGGRFSFKGKK